MKLTIHRLDSGYWMIHGYGPCEWTQPPTWPCSEEEIRTHAFPEASEVFLRAAADEARKITAGEARGK